MTTSALVTVGRERARVGPWHGDRRIGYVAPQPGGAPASPRLVGRCLEHLATSGYREVITAALGESEFAGFVEAGFTVSERLHLLALPLTRGSRPARTPHPAVALRRARSADVEAVLAVDRDSFGAFWRLDRAGLADARRATVHDRFRVAVIEKRIVGYAVTGRQAATGYIQRLAVAPSDRRQGIGVALVDDAVSWLARWRATKAFVNTQEGNEAALALYERLGFVRQSSGLAVLRAHLTP